MPSSLLLTTDAVGGVWRYTLDLAAGLSERGLAPIVAVLGPAANRAQRHEAEGIPKLRLVQTGLPLDWTAESPVALAGVSERLATLAALTGVRSVHLHAPALVGAARWPVPVVAVCHSDLGTWWRAMRAEPPPPDFAWRIGATAQGLDGAVRVVAPTAAHADAMRAVYGPLTIDVVHNGTKQPAMAGPDPAIDAMPLAQADNACAPPSPFSRLNRVGARIKSGHDRGEGAILTAGRLWDEAKSAALLDHVSPTLGAPIRAAGPTTGPNGAKIDLPHLELLGSLDRAAMAQAYASATVFTSMAKYEPFGLAVLEAARAGLRLVLSDIPTFRELWDGAATFVAGPADLAPVLRRALGTPGDGGARERAGRYTVDAMVDRTLAIHRMLARAA